VPEATPSESTRQGAKVLHEVSLRRITVVLGLFGETKAINGPPKREADRARQSYRAPPRIRQPLPNTILRRVVMKLEDNVFNDLPLLLAVPRAAQLLGISRAAAYRLAASGDLPVRRLGGRVYVVTAGLRELAS
jgi:hypothetical protein